MQLSAIQSGGDSEEMVYMRLKITDNQTVISKSLKIVVPKDINSQKSINHYFTYKSSEQLKNQLSPIHIFNPMNCQTQALF